MSHQGTSYFVVFPLITSLSSSCQLTTRESKVTGVRVREAEQQLEPVGKCRALSKGSHVCIYI